MGAILGLTVMLMLVFWAGHVLGYIRGFEDRLDADSGAKTKDYLIQPPK